MITQDFGSMRTSWRKNFPDKGLDTAVDHFNEHRSYLRGYRDICDFWHALEQIFEVRILLEKNAERDREWR